MQVPADEAGRAAAGMAAFHCYNTAALAGLDSYLRLDAAHGFESAAVVWGCARLAPLPACALGRRPCWHVRPHKCIPSAAHAPLHCNVPSLS